MTIMIYDQAGAFAENKDIARRIRIEQIMPAITKGEVVQLNFTGVTGVTQSFMHALLAELIRTYGDDVYDQVLFINCTPLVQEIVNIVADYMQESVL
ncbi:MAG: DUF4325 domain-containing protein [Candidatus Saccharibacteria bacterium]|nr:DUF4325 domain-containing protein [Candidatus Saccharibacteria bacterium]